MVCDIAATADAPADQQRGFMLPPAPQDISKLVVTTEYDATGAWKTDKTEGEGKGNKEVVTVDKTTYKAATDTNPLQISADTISDVIIRRDKSPGANANFPIICARFKTTSRNTGLEAVSGMCSSARALTTTPYKKSGVGYVMEGYIDGTKTDKGMDSYDFYTNSAWGIDTSLGNGADKWWWDSPCFDDEDKAHGACVTDDNGR